MADDGVIQLRRNPSKQKLSRVHLSRYGKSNKPANARTSKLAGANTRKPHGLHTSHSQTSLNQSSGATSINDSGEQVQQSPRNTGHMNRLQRSGKSSASMAVGSHRHKALGGGLSSLAHSHRKPIIQLDREDDDDEDDDRDDDGTGKYEDYEDDDENNEPPKRPPPPDRSDSQLSIGIQPVEPTPPKLSEETVISVSSLADMASALKGAREKSGFVGNDDLISTAVNRSKNLGNMARMVHGWNSAKQRHSASTKSLPSSAGNEKNKSIKSPGEEDPREYEKVFREYTNTRAITNPVISSLYRLSMSHNFGGTKNTRGSSSEPGRDSESHNASRLQLPPVKMVNSLVATTANQMSDYSDRNVSTLFRDSFVGSQDDGTIESATTSTLNKIWQGGWRDPLEHSANGSLLAQPAQGIHIKAQNVNRQLQNARNKHSESSLRLAQ